MKIYVGNLHCKASMEKLYDLFAEFGTVLLIEVPIDGNGKSLGYGYVYMKEENEGRTAILELNNLNFMNQFLTIYEVKM
ncbi:RNA recognition motif. (a.k.a. RRM, RBD, or RNP domain) [Chitinophaga terrae (ex Kim and Jung 2007)]|jgi:RNA recognition motif-containing protein|uniref:RNA recognition motif. (A.k.a. RRM, RBD, or RNP domain) n=1 Tax=Chitinophaga terrae (ex Kim and Jung 2007) TaxID=408074 RepID=A0A1H3ZMG9_9BACT|nr:RNA-binding protein [Chitinophaga terrae (ex Kim and Jung 2007)]GEP88839.1 RNA-binding protein [Chitinophaga terrae (ex Kim and Jung 2007)]SEA24847.1 RNA recognition motif. (a.k.a. RRM, RBD, or RNP domain) [Chitinophaga terrae (ex Kim and Jung 2007)]